MWWIAGIVAIWILVAMFAALWIGQAISHTELEESAAELRRAERHEQQTNHLHE
ncbi:hypothetical protein [Rhodococcus sp. KBS0724]|jgi:hypothetical protein|uniref:hypothetical protein n=1 Tax=Rhodococcus sp. KBS0724 TaxID=1179674 RepID=UPI00163D439E|nr:hypothetical protein [Rhodococcus sp. KBS0724]